MQANPELGKAVYVIAEMTAVGCFMLSLGLASSPAILHRKLEAIALGDAIIASGGLSMAISILYILGKAGRRDDYDRDASSPNPSPLPSGGIAPKPSVTKQFDLYPLPGSKPARLLEHC